MLHRLKENETTQTIDGIMLLAEKYGEFNKKNLEDFLNIFIMHEYLLDRLLFPSLRQSLSHLLTHVPGPFHHTVNLSCTTIFSGLGTKEFVGRFLL